MGAFQAATPLFPPSLVGCSITVSATSGAGATSQLNTPIPVLQLIQQIGSQYASCSGAAMEVIVSVDSVPLYFGDASVTNTNYGICLGLGVPAVAQAYTFRTSFPGAASPLGDIYIYATQTTTFHVLAVL
jgi:hypothetical protein